MIDVKRTISITEARKRIFDIADEVQTPNRVYTLTAEGKPKAVILSAEEYESLLETIEVNRIFPNLNKDIAEVEDAFRTGEHKKWPKLEDLERDWGFAVAEKPKKKYGVHTRNKAKSKKKSR
ncbi:MAG: type II toxin-antitoxin system Phd/YefM family antitoxin [Patescibacteria group bacterium]